MDRSNVVNVEELLGKLEKLLKDADVVAELTERGVNASLAVTALFGLRAYLAGKKDEAAEDLGLVAEEIRVRARVGKESLPS